MEFWVLDFLSEVEMDSNVWVAIATFCLACVSLYISISTNKEVRRNIFIQYRYDMTQHWATDLREHSSNFISRGVLIQNYFYSFEITDSSLAKSVIEFESSYYTLRLLVDRESEAGQKLLKLADDFLKETRDPDSIRNISTVADFEIAVKHLIHLRFVNDDPCHSANA